MEAPKASRLVLYTDLGERPDPAMEAPDRPSKEGKHRSTLAIGEGKRGAGWEATFTCVCSRRSPHVLGTPLGATRAAAPPRWGKASLGRRAAALASHPRPEPRELESRARSPAPAAAAALGQPRLGAAPPPRERGGRGRRCTRELGLGWSQYILTEAPVCNERQEPQITNQTGKIFFATVDMLASRAGHNEFTL